MIAELIRMVMSQIYIQQFSGPWNPVMWSPQALLKGWA